MIQTWCLEKECIHNSQTARQKLGDHTSMKIISNPERLDQKFLEKYFLWYIVEIVTARDIKKWR